MMRIGQGIDVHAFAEERPLILGGVRISERGGLAGHSDADAVLHALTDAILGAAGLGDIGQYFPSDDERWRDASSEVFVRETLRMYGGKIANVDVTIVAQRPKLAPHREPMRDNIARLLGVDADRVNIKFTTTDHLGFIGRGEGLCAMAVVLLA
jgi:2-C-methyl-D-erythritol 2,4-cyclodiphosphate synthase